MKLSIITLILLIATACAPRPTIVPLPTQVPIPIVVTSEPPITSVPIPSTSVPVCTCPSGIVTPAQSEAGGVGIPPIICNCPAILLSPPVDATDDGSGPLDIPSNAITLADNDKTFTMHQGDSFLLNLGMDTFDWTVEIDNQNVLSRVKGVMVTRGAQGIFAANSPGKALLTAVGNPLCRNSVPPCEMPSIMFRITVIVQ